MKKYILIVVHLIFSVSVFASDSTKVVLKTFVPEQHHGLQFQLIGQMLNSFHYRKLTIDNKLSEELLKNYISHLDASKIYFLQADIDTFSKFKTTLDDDIIKGSVDAGFYMYNVYQKRLEERIYFALDLLNKNLDFSIQDSFLINRDSATWVKNYSAYDKLWVQKIKYEVLQLKTENRTLETCTDLVKKRYQNLLKQLSKSKNEDVFSFYVNSLTEIADPHTNYYSPRIAEDFNTSMSLSLEGIGATLQTENEYTKIVTLVKGGPAERSKLIHVNDRIVAVGQDNNGEMVNVLDWRIDDVVSLIRGKKGTVVRLEIIPFDATNNKTKIISIIRDKIVLEDQSAKSSVKTFTRNGKTYKTGVVSIPTFYLDWRGMQNGDANYKSTTKDVKKLIIELKKQKIDNLIIDLRNNGGGSLFEAVELSGLFIKKGPVVQVKDGFGVVNAEEDKDDLILWNGPMAVLVNRFSASASEIFAAAMQDYGTALVVGEQTYGKGTVQNIQDLNQYLMINGQKLGQVKITTAKFYRVSGGSTQFKGVIPDIVFPSAYADKEFGEDASDYALPYDEIKPLSHDVSSKIKDKLSVLNQKHEERMQKNDEYKYLMEDIAQIKDARKKLYVTLNQLAHDKEIKETDDQKKQREESRKLNKKESEEIDLILNETKEILVDYQN